MRCQYTTRGRPRVSNQVEFRVDRTREKTQRHCGLVGMMSHFLGNKAVDCMEYGNETTHKIGANLPYNILTVNSAPLHPYTK